MDNLSWFQDWYAAQCNGEWEHQHGLSITTLDNPGWALKVDLSGTIYAPLNFEKVERSTEQDWVVCRKVDEKFEGFGGARNLDEIIGIFRSFITTANCKTQPTSESRDV